MKPIIATLLCCAALNTQAQALVPPDQTVAGMTQAAWSQAWWQWAGSFEAEDSPVGDRTGAMCGRKQGGTVWFLAGTYGTQRTVRSCHVPSGRYLFFPLINYIVMPRVLDLTNCEAVKASARAMTDAPQALLLELDGQRIEGLAAHRQAPTECFDMGALAQPRLRIFPSAANGYYVMLKPLSPGTHTLNFGGVLPSMVQGVTYTLIVD